MSLRCFAVGFQEQRGELDGNSTSWWPSLAFSVCPSIQSSVGIFPTGTHLQDVSTFRNTAVCDAAPCASRRIRTTFFSTSLARNYRARTSCKDFGCRNIPCGRPCRRKNFLAKKKKPHGARTGTVEGSPFEGGNKHARAEVQLRALFCCARAHDLANLSRAGAHDVEPP